MVEERDIYIEIIRSSSKEHQIRMAVEEMGELIVAINHYRRGKCSLEDVVGEMVDVDITLNQLKIIYDVEDLFGVMKEKELREKIDNLIV